MGIQIYDQILILGIWSKVKVRLAVSLRFGLKEGKRALNINKFGMHSLLWREIPMAWGTTIDTLTPKINPFLYATETKYLTLKDLDSYLIPDD